MFHSGINRPSIMQALPEGLGLCLCFGDATEALCAEAMRRLASGTPVMLDNGAFRAKTPMTATRAGSVLDWYDRFAGVAGDGLYVVAPDVIGDGPATVALQAALAPRLRDLVTRCTVIVPVQGVDCEAAAAAWRTAIQSIGPKIVAGIPSNKAAWSGDMVREFIARTGCKQVHFLGGSSQVRRDLAAELKIAASSDSSFAVRFASNTSGRMANLARAALLAERRVAGRGRRFHVAEGQTRWPWAWGPS